MESNLTSVKNIIFDLGGVILNIDPQLTVDEMKKLGVPDFEKQYSQFKQDKVFDKLEKGMISEDEFVHIIKGSTNGGIDKEDIIKVWNKLLLDFPPERIKLLERLNRSGRFRTFLLSNTNSIHKKTYTNVLRQQFGIEGLEALFEKAYFSHEIQMRKPDTEIYEYVLKDSGLIPEETLFIDDSQENLSAAQKIGIKTYLVNSDKTIIDLFDSSEAIQI